MQGSYSQIRAMLAITKGSLRSTLRSPSSVVFSIGFPLIFILVFGFMGGGSSVSFKIAFDPQSDTTNDVYKRLTAIPAVKVVRKSQLEVKEDLEKGRMLAIVRISKNEKGGPDYIVHLTSSGAVNPQNLHLFKGTFLSGIISDINAHRYPNVPSVATVAPEITEIPGRVYRTIDFILPGQLGFSLLSAGVFGVAFLFFNLRQQLVLKRFFATPVTRPYIILGEALSRVIFQMITAVIIIGIGTLAFHFTLVHGFRTFLEIMILSFIALVVFMGYGFVVSGISKTESTIPPLANLFTLPQFLLAGTFFSIEAFPSWLQPICRVLPLTHFNNAMRNIAFEGASLISCWQNIGVMLIWGVIIYAIAIKVFKWE
ncbi:ABC transporter permease [Filimonas effusa]|uniref:Transport permease protein n=1 Tax=Filimonas effusa TaxID=2508721 RepID=A0A4Q1DC74_9BACT|nr:ABC transporter permease [Filimonas effusa]RXK86425.1 ABC transporter permease [Filimonas effusa]